MAKKIKKTSDIYKVKNSKIFQPYRVLGLVTENLPFAIQKRGTEYFITVSVGNAFQIFDLSKLRLKFVSQQINQQIISIESKGDSTFIASSDQIYHFIRSKKAGMLHCTSDMGDIYSIHVLNDNLISLHKDSVLRIFSLDSKELSSEIPLGNDFLATTYLHPATYVNKILLGSNNGTMQLWNIKNHKLLYSFPSFGSPITCMEQSPAVDVVAIGLADGTIIIHNIRADQTIFRFHQENQVTSISFRTESSNTMATGSNDGSIALWDLDERRLVHVIRDAHAGLINSMKFLDNLPILVTSGSDNSIKEWIFDNLDGVPRVLRFRSGHYGPPSFVRYYDDDGRYILSAGRDRALRLFCTVRDEQNIELSQGKVVKKVKSMNSKLEELKLPFASNFSCMATKQRDWDNIITCHQGYSKAKTWTFEKKSLGSHDFESTDKSSIKCSAISSCGNFGLIGSAKGSVDIFYMQSGLHKISFVASQDGKPINGVQVDASNRTIITGGSDGYLKLWDFTSLSSLTKINLNSPITRLSLHQENDLLLAITDDGVIHVVDIDTQKVVRRYKGHQGRITDFAFSPDGRWVVSCGVDYSIRTWDIPSGHMVDIFMVESIATSISFSPVGDYIATSHVNSLGIYLWANRAQFMHVSLGRIPSDILSTGYIEKTVELPTIEGNATDEIPDDYSDEAEAIVYQTQEQLIEGMISLSTEPRVKWKNLLDIENMKKQGKPKEEPKKPEKAPFFLPTVAGLEPKFDLSASKKQLEYNSKILDFADISDETDFIKQVKKSSNEKDYRLILKTLLRMSPSDMDYELRSISTINGSETLLSLLVCIKNLIKLEIHFEIIQAFLCATLNIHGDFIIGNLATFEQALKDLEKCEQNSMKKLDPLFQSNLCLIDFLRQS